MFGNGESKGSLGESQTETILDAIVDPNLKDLCVDIAEVAFDSILKEGPLKELPFLGSLIKTVSVGLAIRDKLFVKKVGIFLQEINRVSPDRKRLIDSIASDEKERMRIGEALVIYLDRQDAMRKPVFLARAFKAFLEKTIDLAQFRGLAHAIESINAEYIDELKNHCDLRGFSTSFGESDDKITNFTLAGLISLYLRDIDLSNAALSQNYATGSPGDYSFTDLGRLFHYVVLSDPPMEVPKQVNWNPFDDNEEVN